MIQFEVRDMRHKEKFFIDDAYLNGYAKLCGSNATLVYLCLCRHADRNQESFPSIELMAEKTGISRDSVMRGIKSLIEWNIILKERDRREDAKWLNNRYLLLDKSVWKPKPSSTQRRGAKSQIDPSQVANEGVSQVAHSDTKDTHRKDTHTKDAAATAAGGTTQSSLAPEVIKAFEAVDPKNKTSYGNKTQRAAADFLVSEYGLEQVLSAIAVLPQTNAMPYMPSITTPYELKEKWVKLQDAMRRKKVELTKPKRVVLSTIK